MDNQYQWGDTRPLSDMHYGNALWQFPRPTTFMPRPQGQLTNEALVKALLADEKIALLKAVGIACLCPDCLGVDVTGCATCLGDGYCVGLPVTDKVEELPL